MTCIRPGDCAVYKESIQDPFGSARPSARLLRLGSPAGSQDESRI